jgi:PAS domain S-box-containing protein
LRQTQQLLTLLRASTALVGHFDVAAILRQAAEGVALGISADNVLITLLDETQEERTMRVEVVYPPMPLPYNAAFPLSAQPAISNAVQLGLQVAWTRPQRGIHTLAMLMGSDVGPGIIQPMIYQERVLGVIVALNGRSQREFSEGEQRVLEAFSAQVAAAAENAFLYRRLDTQARELARLLAAREEEAGRQAAILESIADGVIVTDNQDQVMLANAAAAAILEIPREELPGQPFGAVFGQVIPIHNGGVMGELTAPGQDTLRAVFQIGSRYIQSSLAPVHGPGGQHLGLVAVLRDITAERAAEQAKTEFISTISHELRTPLTSIKGYADLLVAGAAGEVNPVQKNFAESIRTGSERLTGIVNSVIQFSELEQGSVQIRARPIDVGAVIAETVGSMRSKFEARELTLMMDISADLPNVHADPDRTRQIIEQLLDNAMRFTPAGGQVTARAAPSWDGTSVERPSFVAVTVTDTGVGLTLPDQRRIFERFYRADNSMQVTAGGLGIGLSIAHALAQKQGGQLWAESPGATDDQPGNGSVFTLLLPTARPDVAAAEPQQEASDLTAWMEDALSFLDEKK